MHSVGADVLEEVCFRSSRAVKEPGSKTFFSAPRDLLEPGHLSPYPWRLIPIRLFCGPLIRDRVARLKDLAGSSESTPGYPSAGTSGRNRPVAVIATTQTNVRSTLVSGRRDARPCSSLGVSKAPSPLIDRPVRFRGTSPILTPILTKPNPLQVRVGPEDPQRNIEAMLASS